MERAKKNFGSFYQTDEEQVEDVAGGGDFGYQPLNNEKEFNVHCNYVNNPYDPREERQEIEKDPGSMYVQNKSDERYNIVHHPATILPDGSILDKDEWDRKHWQKIMKDN